MVPFINALTGGPMWVHESRVEEYKAAGHRLAAEPSAKVMDATIRRQKSKKK